LAVLGPARTETISLTRTLPVAKKGESLALEEAFGKLPLTFEANQGQTDRRVQFLSRGNGYSLFITATEAVLALRGSGEAHDSSDRGAVLRMKLVGSNRSPVATGLDPLPGTSNYLIGKDPKQWRKGVRNYGRVRFGMVYPGVDLVYYGNQHQLEYDFVVAAGADPSVITLGFTGEERVEIDKQGDLKLETHAGEVRWHKPIVYQDVAGVRKMVEGHYVRKGEKAVGFAVASYDPRSLLVIDPVLVYSTYLGGSGSDGGGGVAVDALGNVYVAGFTQSIDFPTTSGAFRTSRVANTDAFVTKLNPAGSALVYSTYLGGSGNDVARAIAVDSSGNAYVLGDTTSSIDFPTTAGAFQSSYGGGNTDAFVTKLNPAGNALVFSTYFGGSLTEFSRGLAVDSSGNVYVAGRTDSDDLPTVNAFQPTLHSDAGNGFVTKLNPNGNALVYSTYLGGTGNDDAFSIAVDSLGSAYVTGLVTSIDFPTTPGALQTGIGGGFLDAFATKLNATGGLVYSTYLGGSANDEGFGIAVDTSGNAYVTGITASTDFHTTTGAFQTSLVGNSDAFVTKLNPSGSASVYSTYLGGSAKDQGLGIAVDSSGNAYIKGDTASINFPMLSPFQSASGGGTDLFVTKLSPDGSALVYSSYLGGSGTDEGYGLVSALAVDSSGNVYVTGVTSSTDFPTVAAVQAASAGGGDGFVAKIGTGIVSLPPTIAKAFGAPSIPLGSNTSLTFTLANPNPDSLSGVGFSDPLPAGMIVAAPNGLTNSCGGTVTAPVGSSSIVLAGGSITANGTCTVSVSIAGVTLGSWTNVTGNVTSSEGGSGGTANAGLQVIEPFPNCHGKTISAYAQLYGGLRNAASALGFPSVQALQDYVRKVCGN